VNIVFLDSGPIIARVNDKDPDHRLVLETLEEIKEGKRDVIALYTTNYIIDEAVTHLLYSTGRHDIACKVLDLVEMSDVIKVLWIEQERFSASMKIKFSASPIARHSPSWNNKRLNKRLLLTRTSKQ